LPVFIGNLPFDATEEDFRTLLTTAGSVVGRHGKFYSVDNRRLSIMHMYSRRTQSYNLRVCWWGSAAKFDL
jgi:RNA recognition motif-containing protein